MIDRRKPRLTSDDVVLPPEAREALEEVVIEQRKRDHAPGADVRPRRVLVCGPRGCGKTSFAEALASELDVGLVVLRLDRLGQIPAISRVARLEHAFADAGTARAVMLVELDQLLRPGAPIGVLDAVVELSLDHRPDSPVVATATDEALVPGSIAARFDLLTYVGPPTSSDEVALFLERRLASVRHDLPLHDRAFLQQFLGRSYASLERVLLRAIERSMLSGVEPVASEFLAKPETDPGRNR